MGMSREGKALFGIVRLCLGNTDSIKPESMLKRCDMDALGELTARCGIDGFLYTWLSAKGADRLFNTDFLQSIFRRAGLTAIKNTSIRNEMLALSNKLAACSIRHIFLKGVQMVERAYGDLSCRAVSDIDLLVEKTQCQAVIGTLEASGYEYQETWMAQKLPAFNKERAQRDLNEIPFVKKAKPFDIVVDLHIGQNMFQPGSRLNSLFPAGEIPWFDHTMPLAVQGQEIPCLDNEASLLHMICHYALHHRFIGVKWLIDICQLIRRCGSTFNWRKFDESLRHHGLRRTACLCLLLARDTSGLDLIPDGILSALSNGRRHAFLVRAYRNMVFRESRGALDFIREGLLMVTLAAGLHDKISVLGFMLFDRGSIENRFGHQGSRIPAVAIPFFRLWVKRGMSGEPRGGKAAVSGVRRARNNDSP